MNDLHTASLTAELAALLGGAALINEAQDRNDIDLNRVSEANQRAPWFLERLADMVDAAVRRHGRATLLALHGWNVVQPVVDLGLGCTPGENPFAVGRAAAVSPAFAARALPRHVEACRARGSRPAPRRVTPRRPRSRRPCRAGSSSPARRSRVWSGSTRAARGDSSSSPRLAGSSSSPANAWGTRREASAWSRRRA